MYYYFFYVIELLTQIIKVKLDVFCVMFEYIHMEYQYAEQDSDLIIINAALPEPECMKAKKKR